MDFTETRSEYFRIYKPIKNELKSEVKLGNIFRTQVVTRECRQCFESCHRSVRIEAGLREPPVRHPCVRAAARQAVTAD